jgi:hypothetical protein
MIQTNTFQSTIDALHESNNKNKKIIYFGPFWSDIDD